MYQTPSAPPPYMYQPVNYGMDAQSTAFPPPPPVGYAAPPQQQPKDHHNVNRWNFSRTKF